MALAAATYQSAADAAAVATAMVTKQPSIQGMPDMLHDLNTARQFGKADKFSLAARMEKSFEKGLHKGEAKI